MFTGFLFYKKCQDFQLDGVFVKQKNKAPSPFFLAWLCFYACPGLPVGSRQLILFDFATSPATLLSTRQKYLIIYINKIPHFHFSKLSFAAVHFISSLLPTNSIDLQGFPNSVGIGILTSRN